MSLTTAQVDKAKNQAAAETGSAPATSLTTAQVDKAKNQFADWIKGQPGMSGVEFQPSRVFILTNGMTPETKAAIRNKLDAVMPVEFYEIGAIKAQSAVGG